MTNEEHNLCLSGAARKDYDRYNMYGAMMSGRRLDGYVMFPFTQNKENGYAPLMMDEKHKGHVYFNGKETDYLFFKSNYEYFGYWLLCVNVRDKDFRDGESYVIRIEGFRTEDGYVMQPEEKVLDCPEKPKYDAAYPYPYNEHDEATYTVACEGAVLLDNKTNLLPLKNKKINVFGDIYNRFYNMAAGAGSIFPRKNVGFTEGMEGEGFEFNQSLYDFFRFGSDKVPDSKTVKKAKEFSDTAIITVSRGSSENVDNGAVKGDYYLTDSEREMIKRVTDVFDNTVVILNVGYPIEMKWIDDFNIKSVLWFGFGGQYGGRALAAVLSGRVNPSARLPDTWAYDYFDIPSSRNFIKESDIKDKDNLYRSHITDVYEEGIYVGYRYFDTFGVKVKYPFGRGLSYTDFKYEATSLTYSKDIRVKAKVTNTGKVEGKFALCLFISEPDGKMEKCAHKLVDFSKTELLLPNKSQTLSFKITEDDLASFDEEKCETVIEKGIYTIYLGTDLDNLTKVDSFTQSSDKTLKKLNHYCVSEEKIKTLSKFDNNSYPKEASSYRTDGAPFDFKIKQTHFHDKKIKAYDGAQIYYEDVEKDPKLLDSFVSQMSVEELARINVCNKAWKMDENGVAGSVFPIEKYRMKPFFTADGNAALRIKKRSIGFPSSNMVCASFNKKMPYLVGKTIGEESFDKNIHVSLAPGMNLHRNPLCGRNAEYFSEDPVLSGKMAGAHIKGLKDAGCGAVIKHFIANGSELCRMRSQSIVPERALRELYVRNFEIAIKECMPCGVMTSYNALNGCYTAEDEELIYGILRRELGFKGYVMTDWNSHFTCDFVRAVAAGNCWITPGSADDKFTAPIVDAVREGKISLNRLRTNAKNHIKVMIEFTKKHKEV